MKLTLGCSTCMADGQPGRGGLPGMVFTLERRWRHSQRDRCSQEQLATGRVCTDGDHDNDCMLVKGPEYEVLKPCTCNQFWIHPEDEARRRKVEKDLRRQDREEDRGSGYK